MRIRKVLATILVLSAALPPVVFAGGWIDDWLSQKTSSGPGYYAGQKRGYATAGTFSARWQSSTDYPISINPPSFRAGCGGIDFFGGSVSFLNMDMLVEKMQRILQNSAAIAFKMALTTVCPSCSSAADVMESISNQLNSLALDDCKEAKGLVLAATNAAQPVIDGIKTGILSDSVTKDLSEGWTQAKRELDGAEGSNISKGIAWLQGKTASAPDVNPRRQGCAPLAKEFFPASTSAGPVLVLDVVGPKLGFGQEHVNLMRGLVGDIQIWNADQAYTVIAIPSCKNNEGLNEDKYANGKLEAMTPDGACYEVTDANANMTEYVRGMLTSIATKMKNKTVIAAGSAEENFIINSPLPIAYALRVGIATGQENELVGNLSAVTAQVLMAKSLNTLSSMMHALLQKAHEARDKVANSQDSECDIGIHYAVMEKEQKELQGRIGHVQTLAQRGIEKGLEQFTKVIEVAGYLEAINGRLHSELSARFGLAVAQRALNRL